MSVELSRFEHLCAEVMRSDLHPVFMNSLTSDVRSDLKLRYHLLLRHERKRYPLYHCKLLCHALHNPLDILPWKMLAKPRCQVTHTSMPHPHAAGDDPLSRENHGGCDVYVTRLSSDFGHATRDARHLSRVWYTTLPIAERNGLAAMSVSRLSRTFRQSFMYAYKSHKKKNVSINSRTYDQN